MPKIIHLICAARPNFVKIAELYKELAKQSWCDLKMIHTGQHYDYQMSQAFFDEFDLPKPDFHLNIGSGSHAEQTAQTMMAYEKLCLETSTPDLVIVVGDVNATLACSVTAKKLHYAVAHLEAGLRSHDRTMPEEINRIVTDSISDYHWIPSSDASDNLLREGIRSEQIKFVGNIMIDTYCSMKPKIDASEYYKELNLQPKSYGVLTLHRPTNVDSEILFGQIMEQIGLLNLPIVFPAHPRTKKTLDKINTIPNNVILIEPQCYTNFMNLISNSCYVISDSGGIQEETTFLNVPCFTLRDSTERPITITLGTNQLTTIEGLLETVKNPKKGSIPELWDGKTSKRIADHIQEILG